MRDAKPFIPPKFVAHFGFNTGTSESTFMFNFCQIKKDKNDLYWFNDFYNLNVPPYCVCTYSPDQVLVSRSRQCISFNLIFL